MVDILLSNYNQSDPVKSVVVRVSSDEHICTLRFQDGQSETLQAKVFLDKYKSRFSHPVLSAELASYKKGDYCISYRDMLELQTVLSRFYATLIYFAPKTIRIEYEGEWEAPSALPLSISHKQKAMQTVGMREFERFVSAQYAGLPFRWFEGILIHDTFKLEDLPPLIKGDLLLEGKTLKEIGIMDTPPVELRYISDEIGLGVFAKDTIAKGQALFMYSGRSVPKSNKPSAGYRFDIVGDGLGRNVDACFEGSYARFVNHAPIVDEKSPLKANLSYLQVNYYGIAMIVFKSLREINPGEQLLIDYGNEYWLSDWYYFEKADNKVLNQVGHTDKKALHVSRNTLRKMAQSGIRQAQLKLLERPFIALLSLLGFIYVLNHTL